MTMGDLDEISRGIGGLQADMRRAMEWFDKHEAADQRRFEELSTRIDAAQHRQGDRVTSLEISRAEAEGGWKALTFVGTLAGAFGAFLYHLLGIKF
jgi:hypothetical protein